MSWSGREAFPDAGGGREAPRMSGSGREALPDVRVWSRGPPGCLGVVGRSYRRSESNREALQDVL